MIEHVRLYTHANFCGLVTWLDQFLRPPGKPPDTNLHFLDLIRNSQMQREIAGDWSLIWYSWREPYSLSKGFTWSFSDLQQQRPATKFTEEFLSTFFNFYKKNLAWRLLADRTSMLDDEEGLVFEKRKNHQATC